MPDTPDSTTSAETGGRKDDPPASQVQINFTGTTPENILQFYRSSLHVNYCTYNIVFEEFSLKTSS
jgi:hypothetical protein